MSIIVNTNMSALRIQSNLTNATLKMNSAMERMSSGYKINSAKDDAAGFAVATNLSSTISGTNVASNNVAIGNDLLSTSEGFLDVVSTNYQRVRDLTEQAANGTYTAADRTKIQAEIDSRLDEITSLTSNATFNGKKLFSGVNGTAVTLQTGVTATDNVVLASSIFAAVDAATLKTNIDGRFAVQTSAAIASGLAMIDAQITNITDRISSIGAAQNKLEAVASALSTQLTNLSSALSTIKDADIAKESATYVQQQILQSASSTLLTQANSAPQIALTLIKG